MPFLNYAIKDFWCGVGFSFHFYHIPTKEEVNIFPNIKTGNHKYLEGINMNLEYIKITGCILMSVCVFWHRNHLTKIWIPLHFINIKIFLLKNLRSILSLRSIHADKTPLQILWPIFFLFIALFFIKTVFQIPTVYLDKECIS